MYIAIAILVLFGLVVFAVKAFVNRKWTLISTTFGNEDYFKIIGRLRGDGITYKTVTPLTGSIPHVNNFKDMTQYDIYVKKEVAHLAYKALQNRNL
ncbi:MAG TPA: hypothetical protein VLK78_03885 [Candidatus Angelobacter sp.]|nr:hypothetical protein [Candidatus Angelobacter sp.]